MLDHPLRRKAEITMPLYRITTPEGSLSSEAKAALAAEITEFHSQMSGLDEAYTKIVFDSFLPGYGFIGARSGDLRWAVPAPNPAVPTMRTGNNKNGARPFD
jgi:phenylpyruvate tautomerase PptA (4-oxalocrotonate tautomerase family)